MKTNDLKKGTRILLRCGWYATIVDNARGNIRMADVEGAYREIGSVYSHDIMQALVSTPRPQGVGATTEWRDVEHTPAQLKLRKQVLSFG